MYRVVMIGQFRPAGHKLLEGRGDISLVTIDHPTAGAVSAAMPDADAIALRTFQMDAALLDSAPKLKIVARHGVGYDNVDLAALTRRKIPLAVVGNVNAVTVAEHTMFFILSLAKRGGAYDRAVRLGNWALRDGFSASELDGKRLLICGFGRIGREVAKRASAFDMNLSVYDPFVDDEAIASAGATPVRDLAAGLAEADFVTLHLPMTDDTAKMINAETLAGMKPTAHVINTARGGLVDEDALYQALADGTIAGAALDVFGQEPPAAGHRFFELDNVLLSPHIAGLTAECADRMAIATVRNVLNVLDGKLDPKLVVNPEVLLR